MDMYEPSVIKSFKHNGRLHRVWFENRRIPEEHLLPDDREEALFVFINRQTPIQEADGKLWTSRVPAVSFFLPGQWFNIVGLLEEQGIRYYCNIASPPFYRDGVLTYIDYDLDVIASRQGNIQVVDRDEYEMHKALYHYSAEVDRKVNEGLGALLSRLENRESPFGDDRAAAYYAAWLNQTGEVRK